MKFITLVAAVAAVVPAAFALTINSPYVPSCHPLSFSLLILIPATVPVLLSVVSFCVSRMNGIDVDDLARTNPAYLDGWTRTFLLEHSSR